ncbi:MAG: hypothetical protein LBU61_06005 [Coriobacteriales bacterium]|nr:hypothetical protein [Coriobacteriales bacterium]
MPDEHKPANPISKMGRRMLLVGALAIVIGSTAFSLKACECVTIESRNGKELISSHLDK